jgi:hypothetical protein
MGAAVIEVCKAIYGIERGAQVQAFLEGAMNEPCPCRQGRVCPLMPVPREALDDSTAATA